MSTIDVARKLGFSDTDVVIAIEHGDRQVSARELVRISQKLGKSIDYFTDSFRLEGEGHCSWRHSGVTEDQLTNYENRANQWVGAYRSLAKFADYELKLLRPALRLTEDSTFSEARETGKQFAQLFNLGQIPALNLRRTMEEELDILVLMVDAPQGISGATYRLTSLDAVLLNRGAPEDLRNLTLVKELFHVLTYDKIPPRSQSASSGNGKRAEQLASAFAETVLIPSPVLRQFSNDSFLDKDKLTQAIIGAAANLRVPAETLLNRLVNEAILSKSLAEEIQTGVKRDGQLKSIESQPPPLFSKQFAKVLAVALQKGRISVRRAARLLEVQIDALPVFFASHGIEYEVHL